MQNKRKKNSLRSLISLYTIVVGVALSLAIVKLIDPIQGLSSLTLSSSLLFFAFVFTLFPFYHGALRHLDDTYIENSSAHIKDGALIIDFALLFFHGMAFVVLSLMLFKPGHFAWVMIGVLSVDVVWGIFAHYGSSSSEGSAEWKWTIINAVTVVISVILLYLYDITLNELRYPNKVALVVFGVCFIRTMADYIWTWKFYFPPENET